MSELEYRCFIGGLAWSTTDRGLRDAFSKFGHLTEAKVVMDRGTGLSRGFGFITFDEKKSMDEAIDEMNGEDLDGRSITVYRSQRGTGRDRGGDRDSDLDRGHGCYYGGCSRGSNSGECVKCGKPGHFASECPSGDGGRGDRYGGREVRYGGRDDWYGGGREVRYGGTDDWYGGGGGGGSGGSCYRYSGSGRSTDGDRR